MQYVVRSFIKYGILLINRKKWVKHYNIKETLTFTKMMKHVHFP